MLRNTACKALAISVFAATISASALVPIQAGHPRRKEDPISLSTEPWQRLAPGCLTHCLDHIAPGFPLSRGLDRHEPGHGPTVTGKHNFVASLGAAHKLGKLCFGIGY